MRSYIVIILVILLFSCRDTQKPVVKNDLNDSLMIGEWRLDSSSNRLYSRDKLILLENNDFYLFSGSNGGSLWSKGKMFRKNSLVTNYNDTLTIELLDTNLLCISGGWPHREDYYERNNYGDFHEDLDKYLKADLLRDKLIGWWKLTSPVRRGRIDLINYHGHCEKFTLNIRADGRADFFLENNFDSIVDYSYKVSPGEIDFGRGCISESNSKVFFDEEGRMKLVLSKMADDTLLLERLTEIK